MRRTEPPARLRSWSEPAGIVPLQRILRRAGSTGMRTAARTLAGARAVALARPIALVLARARAMAFARAWRTGSPVIPRAGATRSIGDPLTAIGRGAIRSAETECLALASPARPPSASAWTMTCRTSARPARSALARVARRAPTARSPAARAGSIGFRSIGFGPMRISHRRSSRRVASVGRRASPRR